jgi:superfamily I DNA/RNA helicase
VRIATFHALGLSIVRAEAKALGLRSGFSVMDPQDLESIVAELVGDRRPLAHAQGAVGDQPLEERARSPADALRARRTTTRPSPRRPTCATPTALARTRRSTSTT